MKYDINCIFSGYARIFILNVSFNVRVTEIQDRAEEGVEAGVG